MKMRDFYLVIISVIISVATTLYIVGKPAKIVVVDQDEIFKQLIVSIQQATAPDNEEVLMEKMEKYNNIRSVLDKRMVQIAKEKNFIILPKSNVIGGEDLTEQAKLLLVDLIEKRRADVDAKE